MRSKHASLELGLFYCVALASLSLGAPLSSLVRSSLVFLLALQLCATTLQTPNLRAQEDNEAPTANEFLAEEGDQDASIQEDQQESEEKASTSATEVLLSAQPPLVAPSGPDVFLLPDKSGKLRMVLGFQYEEFLRLWQNQDKNPTFSPPEYVLEDFQVEGNTEDSLARLKIKLEIVIQKSGWFPIPLQMPKLILLDSQIQKKMDGECVVFDREKQSYVAWLKGEAGSHRQIELQGIVRLGFEADETTLELHAPQSSHANMKLQIPHTELEIHAPPGIQLESIQETTCATNLLLSGQVRPLQFHWKKPQQKPVSTSTLIESRGQQQIRISQRTIRHDIQLDIQSSSGVLETIRVCLPPGTKLSETPSTKEYLIQPEQEGIQEGRQVVRISSLKSESNHWQVPLTAESPLEGDSVKATYSLGGFEVIDAYRQTGKIDLRIDAPLQAYFDLGRNLEQVPNTETTSLATDTKLIGSFRYARVPWNLTAHVLPQQRRVSVRPKYELTFDAQEARLDVEFDYQFTGAKTYFLRIDRHGWQLTDDPLDTEGAIDQQMITDTQQGLINLPLLNPETSRVRLSFVAKKNLSAGLHRIAFPEPLGVFVVDGQLQVDSDPALEFVPRMNASEGLSLVSAVTEIDNSFEQVENTAVLEEMEQESSGTTFRTYRPNPILEAEILEREQEISVAIESDIRLDSLTAQVEQLFKYEVLHRPASQLVVQVPNALWQNDSLTIKLGNEVLEFGLELADDEDASQENPTAQRDTPDSKRLVVGLPRPILGKFQLKVSYSSPLAKVIPTSSVPFDLPLALPLDTLQGHSASVNSINPLQVLLHQGSQNEEWSLLEQTEATQKVLGKLQLQNFKPTPVLPLLLQLDLDEQSNLAKLESVWIQTWLLENTQQTRAVFLFRTENSQVSILLPEESRSSSYEVLLDKQPVSFQLQEENRLVVDLPTARQDFDRTLEIRYYHPARLSNWGEVRTAIPQFEGLAAITPIYWQVILPSQWSVGLDPDQLFGDYWLGWKNYRWGRQPSLDQTELENMFGATELPSPPQSMRQYLYQSFQLPSEIRLLVFHSYWLVLGSILLAFGLGLLCLYTSLVRQKVFWLILALSLLGMTFVYPEITLVLVQAILWGTVLTGMTALLKQLFKPPTTEWIYSTESTAGSTAATESWSILEKDSGIHQQETTASVPVSGGPE